MSKNLKPFHTVNILTGTKSSHVVEEGSEYAKLIKKAKRPLLVVGPRCLNQTLGDKPLLDWALEISQKAQIPICATAHTQKDILAKKITPECSFEVVEIINCLKNPEWLGVKGEGNHDLVLFFGIRTDLANAGLSTLKHYAPALKTLTLCNYYFPHATYSLPNITNEEKWLEFLNNLVANL